MKKSILNLSALAVMLVVLFTACEDDEPKGAYEDGAFIVNEGAFGNSNASVSFYSYGADAVTNNVFQLANDRTLGDVAQSLTINGDEAYIAINASNKIEVVNSNTFKSTQTISEVPGPRYIEVKDSKAYISCWGDNSVKIYDLNSYSLIKSISVASGPEKMAFAANNLYVANTGGWGTDSTVSVIDLDKEEVIASINVKYSPRDIEVDKDGNLWVLCFGKVVYEAVEPWGILEESPSMLYKIDPNTNTVSKSIELFANQHPAVLEIDNDGETLYVGGGFGFGGIYSITEASSTTTKIIDDYAYGLGYDAKSEKLFVSVAPNYTAAGQLIRYETDGTKLGDYQVGIGPNGISFKNAKQ